MAKLIKLITYAYLKDEVEIPQNIPDDELDHKIYRAQEVLRMLMGDEFYQDYVTNYQNNTLSAAYTAIKSKINQFLAWQSYEFWTQRANVKPTRSGFRVHTEENSNPASSADMAVVISEAKTTTQFYKNILVDYLNNNSTTYTLYDSYCNKNLVGNSFKISVVRNKQAQPDILGVRTYKKL